MNLNVNLKWGNLRLPNFEFLSDSCQYINFWAITGDRWEIPGALNIIYLFFAKLESDKSHNNDFLWPFDGVKNHNYDFHSSGRFHCL